MNAPGEAPARRFHLAPFLFNAAGRSGRLAYALGLAPVAVGGRLLRLIPPGWLAGLLDWTLGFALFVVWATLTARRLHDLGRAGWWLAVIGLLAWLSSALATAWPALGAAFGVLALVAQGALLLWPGHAGFNRFGPRSPSALA